MLALSTQTEPRTVRRCTPGAVPLGMVMVPAKLPWLSEVIVPIGLLSKRTCSTSLGTQPAPRNVASPPAWTVRVVDHEAAGDGRVLLGQDGRVRGDRDLRVGVAAGDRGPPVPVPPVPPVVAGVGAGGRSSRPRPMPACRSRARLPAMKMLLARSS